MFGDPGCDIGLERISVVQKGLGGGDSQDIALMVRADQCCVPCTNGLRESTKLLVNVRYGKV
jgi:hypothetical protein